jgi:hypothetical protein
MFWGKSSNGSRRWKPARHGAARRSDGADGSPPRSPRTTRARAFVAFAQSEGLRRHAENTRIEQRDMNDQIFFAVARSSAVGVLSGKMSA